MEGAGTAGKSRFDTGLAEVNNLISEYEKEDDRYVKSELSQRITECFKKLSNESTTMGDAIAINGAMNRWDKVTEVKMDSDGKFSNLSSITPPKDKLP
jgi:hypothetical protein